jgi:hypothetical protein
MAKQSKGATGPEPAEAAAPTTSVDPEDRREVYESIVALVASERTRLLLLVGLTFLVLVFLLVPSLQYPRPGEELLPVYQEAVWVPPLAGFALALLSYGIYRRSASSYRYWIARLWRIESGLDAELRAFTDAEDLTWAGSVVTWRGHGAPQMALFKHPALLPKLPTVAACNLLFMLATSLFFALTVRNLLRCWQSEAGWLQPPWPFVYMLGLLLLEIVIPRLGRLFR